MRNNLFRKKQAKFWIDISSYSRQSQVLNSTLWTQIEVLYKYATQDKGGGVIVTCYILFKSNLY